MEDLVLELVERFDIVHLLPYKVGRIVVEAEVRARKHLEHFAPVCRCAHDVLSARPLIVGEPHRAVLDADADAFFLRMGKDRSPYFLGDLQVLFNGLARNTADECGDHVDAKKSGSIDQFVQMIDIHGTFFKIRIEGVRIISKGGNNNAFGCAEVIDLFSLFRSKVCRIDMADACITSLCAGCRPAGNFKALQIVLCRKIHYFFKCHSFADRCQ